MDWIAFFVICMNIVALQARHDLDWSNPIILIKRRHSFRRHPSNKLPILGAPKNPEDLPEAEWIIPGHTLLRPSLGMLKSAAKFPLTDIGGSVVYGNVDNIGLTNDNNERVLYTNFRKSDDIVEQLKKTIEHSNKAASKGKKNKKANKHKIYEYGKKNKNANNHKIYEYGKKNEKNFQNANPKISGLKKGHTKVNGKNNAYRDFREFIPISYTSKRNFESLDDSYDQENDAREILDNVDPDRRYFEENSDKMDFRRRKTSTKYRKRSYESSKDSEDSDSSSDSDDYERNPGNPYSVFKEKYKQNWMWNHFMDGDHMNINPYGPSFHDVGPSGSDLFFGRKWWYFNQDDYVPMK